MLSEFVNAFLTNEDVCACVLDGVHQVADVVLFLLEEQGELVRVGNLDLGVYFGLLDLNGRVHQGDLRIGNASRHAGMNALLVEKYTVDEGGILD